MPPTSIPMNPTQSTPAAAPAPAAKPSSSFWPEGWWKLMEMRIGILPLPVYLVLLAVIIW
jgi:malate:Na+ symporter